MEGERASSSRGLCALDGWELILFRWGAFDFAFAPWGTRENKTDRQFVVTIDRSYHIKTFFGLCLTSKPKKREKKRALGLRKKLTCGHGMGQPNLPWVRW